MKFSTFYQRLTQPTPDKQQRRIARWKAFWVLFLFVFFQLVVGGLALLLYRMMCGGKGCVLDFNTVDSVAIGRIVLGINLLGIVSLWASKLIRRQLWNRSYRLSAAAWVWGIIGMLFVAFGVNQWCSPFQLSDNGTTEMFMNMRGDVWAVLGLCLIGPLAEECFFREGLIRHLHAGGCSALVAILISSVLFGLVHGNPLQMVPAIVLGMVLGLLYVRVGDMRLSLAAHVTNNSLAMSATYYDQVETSLHHWVEHHTPWAWQGADHLVTSLTDALLRYEDTVGDHFSPWAEQHPFLLGSLLLVVGCFALWKWWAATSTNLSQL